MDGEKIQVSSPQLKQCSRHLNWEKNITDILGFTWKFPWYIKQVQKQILHVITSICKGVRNLEKENGRCDPWMQVNMSMNWGENRKWGDMKSMALTEAINLPQQCFFLDFLLIEHEASHGSCSRKSYKYHWVNGWAWSVVIHWQVEPRGFGLKTESFEFRCFLVQKDVRYYTETYLVAQRIDSHDFNIDQQIMMPRQHRWASGKHKPWHQLQVLLSFYVGEIDSWGE